VLCRSDVPAAEAVPYLREGSSSEAFENKRFTPALRIARNDNVRRIAGVSTSERDQKVSGLVLLLGGV
jgi:hypothetical protein